MPADPLPTARLDLTIPELVTLCEALLDRRAKAIGSAARALRHGSDRVGTYWTREYLASCDLYERVDNALSTVGEDADRLTEESADDLARLEEG